MTENGRIALVSGGNRGIGLEIVRQLADRGMTVILGSRDEEQGRAAAKRRQRSSQGRSSSASSM